MAGIWGMKTRYLWEEAMRVAEELVAALSPACSRIEIAGSIRRHEAWVGDVELLCIPKHAGSADLLNGTIKGLMARGILDYRFNIRGSRIYGSRNKLLRHVATGMPVDIFSTTEECWPVALVVRTGPKESNIAIATAALSKGWHLRAYGSGFIDENGAEIRCHSERDVFELVGLPYKEPWER